VITKMITIFLVPLYTRIFSTQDYAILSIVTNTFAIVNMLVIFNWDSAAFRWYYKSENDETRKSVFSSWFWYQLIVAVFAGFIMVFSLPILFRSKLDIPAGEIFLIWLLPSINLLTSIFPYMAWNWLLLQKKPFATITYTFAQSITTISLTLWFVLVWKWHLIGVLAALLISNLFFSIVALYLMRSWLSISFFSKSLLREMWLFSLPLIPASVAYWLLNSSNAYFILYYTDKAEMGLFSVGGSIAAIVLLFTGAFQQAWAPFSFSISNNEDAPNVYAKIFDIFAIFSGLLILAVFLFSPEILRIFTTPAYYGASWVSAILSISFILATYNSIVLIGASIMNMNKYYTQGVLIGAAVTILLQFILVPMWGKEGSALGTVLGQAIAPVYILFRGQKVYYVPYPYRNAVMNILMPVAIGVCFRYFVFDSSQTLFQFLIKLLILTLYLGVGVYIYRNKVYMFFSSIDLSLLKKRIG